MYQTFAHQINKAKNMLDGLKASGDKLAKWGITADFIAAMSDLHDQANQLESKRNALNASAQETTAQQQQIMADLNNQYSVAKRLVKIEMPKESWPAFGFRAGEFAAKQSQETPETVKPVAL